MGTTITLVMPILGGGTERHFDEMARAWSLQGVLVLSIKIRCRIMHCVLLKSGMPWRSFILDTENESRIRELFQLLHVGIIHYHHFWQLSDSVIRWPMTFSIPYVVTLHDYYTICPYIQLTVDGVYCQERGNDFCNRCIQNHGGFERAFGARRERAVHSIEEWRNDWKNILRQASIIIVPNMDVKRRILKYYPYLSIKVVENPEIQVVSEVDHELTSHREIKRRIGILGVMTKSKGSEVIRKCAQYIEKHHLPIELVLWGDFLPALMEVPHPLRIRGRYKEQEIYSLILREKPDFFWFPAICPETYSYTLSIPIRLKIPVMGTDLGAIGERIKRHGWGETYRWTSKPEEIVKRMVSFDLATWKIKSRRFVVENDHFLKIEDYYDGLISVRTNEEKMLCSKIDQLLLRSKMDLGVHCPRNLNGYETEQLLKNTMSMKARIRILSNVDWIWGYRYVRNHSLKQIFKRVFH